MDLNNKLIWIYQTNEFDKFSRDNKLNYYQLIKKNKYGIYVDCYAEQERTKKEGYYYVQKLFFPENYNNLNWDEFIHFCKLELKEYDFNKFDYLGITKDLNFYFFNKEYLKLQKTNNNMLFIYDLFEFSNSNKLLREFIIWENKEE